MSAEVETRVTQADRVLVAPDHVRAVRWRDGERLEQLFEHRCDRLRETGRDAHVAVDAGAGWFTYEQLDVRANQLARYLLAHGTGPGERIGLLFDEGLYAYVGMLAVLKANAAYVPLDAGFPPDRLAFIAEDAGVRTVLTLSHLQDCLADVPVAQLRLDELQGLLGAEDGRRLGTAEKGDPVDDLCYIIYTSGSTGRPKGVAIEHASICNFVRVAVEVYGMQPGDRVYQGMTIAFDFAVEEIWVPLLAGATLVPKPRGCTLLGSDLREFLVDRGITALCCVPTLLATLEPDLPGLRFLLVSGEACPADLAARWHRPGRRFLNVYGPTEATVTATWTQVQPDRPLTIGVPLPTYAVVILDPHEEKALPPGEPGEIGIAGVGLADGYVNRGDLTDRAFVRDFLGIENNPSGRIYRTGDLGRVNEHGEIEYQGRIDTQVKIRGYRIELTEIESVLLGVPGIAQAVVGTYEPHPGIVELVAYYRLREHVAAVDPGRVYELLRGRLPGYMVPAYLEQLDVIPRLASDKADRKSLPPPSAPRSVAAVHVYVAPANAAERAITDALADVLHLDQVSVDSHFFDDLGANSLVMAHFCARVREQEELPSVSMRDVYLHPTARSLATALPDVVTPPVQPGLPASTVPAPTERVATASTARYVLCGALQLLIFLGYSYLTALVVLGAYEWTSSGSGWVDSYLRSIAFGAASFLYLCLLPIAVKWLLIGRWKREEIAVWSLAYVRFWMVKTLVRANPLVLFAGSPLYVLYLRALGARIGRGAAIFSRTVPVCTDLLSVGDGAVIRKDSSFTCYRAHAGLIQTGPVTVGRDVFVGESTVLDIDTSLGDGAQLGHASALHAYQAVPAGQQWHGSPAQRADVDYLAVAPARCGTLRKVTYSTVQLLNVLVLYLPVGIGAVDALTVRFLGSGSPGPSSWAFYRDGMVLSVVLFLGPMLLGLPVVLAVPRVLNLALRPDRVYPLYGLHYSIQRTIARLTNAGVYMTLFGDSSYIVHYLRALGYDLCRVEQTGSNFGVAQTHETPYLATVGSGTMVSDGLSMINAEFSSSSFRVTRAAIGARNFLGNDIVFPAAARTGDNCLLATKVLVPVHGDLRQDVGLLGSPCFEIPRSVQRDSRFDHLKTGEEFRRRLAAKNRHNTGTIGLFLLVGWVQVLVVTLLTLLAAELHGRSGSSVASTALVVTLLFSVGALLFSVVFSVLVDRASTGFRALRPQFCSIYEPYFWWHERFWKLSAAARFTGTPFQGLMWRLLGVRTGSKLFDDGCGIPEKSLVTIGDGCTLNAGSVIQCHSLEDGTFKSDRITLGDGCTLGAGAFVHYGVTMGDGAVLEPDSFLMKGAEVAPRTRWGGNPAMEVRPTGCRAATGPRSPDPDPVQPR
jgi:non-ribosomal peptide synthetase-like protein